MFMIFLSLLLTEHEAEINCPTMKDDNSLMNAIYPVISYSQYTLMAYKNEKYK